MPALADQGRSFLFYLSAPEAAYCAPLASARMGTPCGVALRRTCRRFHPLCRKGFRCAPMNAPPLRCGAPLLYCFLTS